MNLGVLGHGYLLIGGLVLVGVALLVAALVVNQRLPPSLEGADRHREKRLEYQRNTFTQLGVLLVGIGVSLFIFYFQQDYQKPPRGGSGVLVSRARPGFRPPSSDRGNP